MSKFLQAVKSIHATPNARIKNQHLEHLAIAIWMLSGSNNVNDIVIESARANKELVPDPITLEEVEAYKKMVCDEMLAECEDQNYIDEVTPKMHARMDNALLPLIGTVGLSLGRRLRNYYPCVSKAVPEKIKYKVEHFDVSITNMIIKDIESIKHTELPELSKDELQYHLETQLPHCLTQTHDEAIAFMNKVRDGIRDDGYIQEAIIDLNTCGPYIPKGVSRLDKAICNLPFEQKVFMLNADVEKRELSKGTYVSYNLSGVFNNSSSMLMSFDTSVAELLITILVYYAVKDIVPDINKLTVGTEDELYNPDRSTVFIDKGRLVFFDCGKDAEGMNTLVEVASIPMPDHLHELYS